MKVTSKKVETIIDIEITFHDFQEIFTKFGKNENNRIIYQRAFEGEDLENDSVGYIKRVFEELGSPRVCGDTYRYIAESLGFDGWKNAGYYSKNKQVYKMTVYMSGDCLN